MDAALQRRVQRYGWDKAARYYENFWQAQLKPAQDLLLQMAALQPGEQVIDIACGTGLVSFPAAAAVGAGGAVLATDISEEMVKIGRQLAAEKQLHQVEFERMDAEALQAPADKFEAALCALGLMYVPDPLAALKEMNRVLRPGGRAIAAVWGQRDHCGWADIFEIVDRRVASEVCPMFFQLGTGDMLQRVFEAAGFTRTRGERISTTLHYASGEDACGAAFAGGPVALAYNKFSDAVKDEVHAEYLASIEKFRDGKAFNIPGEFVVHLGYCDG